MNRINVTGKFIAPSKIVCIGRNFVDHIKELNNEMPDQAVIFVKPNSAISEQIISDKNEAIHYEAELSFVIEQNNIVAVGFGLDLTKRALQTKLKTKGLPWERAKAFDNSAVFSEFVDFSGNVKALTLQLFINEQLIQHANYDLMIHKPDAIIDEVRTFMSFSDGDILMTGTPKGVGVVAKNDLFTGKVYLDDKIIIDKSWQVQ